MLNLLTQNTQVLSLTRTVKKIAHTVCACDGSEVNDGLEVLGDSRAAIRQVGDSL